MGRGVWSQDSKYVYAQEVADGSGQDIFRVRIKDRKRESIAGSGQIPRADISDYDLVGLTPQGEPLVTLLHGGSDIYSLDVDFPWLTTPLAFFNHLQRFSGTWFFNRDGTGGTNNSKPLTPYSPTLGLSSSFSKTTPDHSR
jgi:hypothetical protein